MLTREALSLPEVQAMMQRREMFYVNPKRRPMDAARPILPLGLREIADADARLRRFGPLMQALFPETRAQSGVLESPLQEIPNMAERLRKQGNAVPRLLIKRDDALPVAGSVKARGGVYEVLRHAEDLARMGGLLQRLDSYSVLADRRDFFARYAVEVGSTGNLGLAIGRMSAALGFRATVHMSADAKEWKKALLRSEGVTVMEYAGDYGAAVAQGRQRSAGDPKSYFVDDENSVQLFLGYAVAARRLRRQLQGMEIPVDAAHPLLVCIPCGVGGAPGGIAFGLRQELGDHVHCFTAEPVEAPCMALGLATVRHSETCVQEIGLSGKTVADGLAVGRPSAFVGKLMEPVLDGCFTVTDQALQHHMLSLWRTERIFVEPSAAAGFAMAERLWRSERYGPMAERGTMIVWATGGSLVPKAERRRYLSDAAALEGEETDEF